MKTGTFVALTVGSMAGAMAGSMLYPMAAPYIGKFIRKGKRMITKKFNEFCC